VTAEKLALAAGVSPRTVQNWESATGTFDFESAIKISEAPGCTLYELAGRPAPEAPAPKKKGGGK
jgi:transcriptional regulator with XRE-family HTH domain